METEWGERSDLGRIDLYFSNSDSTLTAFEPTTAATSIFTGRNLAAAGEIGTDE